MYELLGYLGTIIVCGSAIPQIIKSLHTKSTGDISLIYIASLVVGLSLIEVYSVYIKDPVFLAGNTVSLILSIVLLLLCIRYDSGSYKKVRNCRIDKLIF